MELFRYFLYVFFFQNMFAFQSNDRFIPTRQKTTADFLKKTRSDYFDVSASENGMKTMRNVQYQNHLRKNFLEQQQESKVGGSTKQKKPEKIKLIHEDWACKISEMRIKFLPDFETLKKPMFGVISK